MTTVLLAGCEDVQNLSFLNSEPSTGTDGDDGQVTSTGDVEAPDVFQATEAGLWDGRPSLGGIWVAHPSVTDPQRVLIRNTSNGKSVIGALFRREWENPGPRIQVSSEAATELGMLAGAPVQLNVTALKRNEPEKAPEAEKTAPTEETASPKPDTTTDATPASAPASAATTAAAPAAAPESNNTQGLFALKKPYVEAGAFGIKSNAEGAVFALGEAGVTASLREVGTGENTTWRVVAGPSENMFARSTLLKQIKAAGFPAARAVAQ